MSELLSDSVTCGKKRARLSLAISAALLGLSPFAATAQTSPQNDSDVIAQNSEQPVEVIEVKGIRGSIQSAQELKRYADTVKDVITATDIGALPDK